MLNTLKIQNFTCFPEAELHFSKGLNVIVGENGTGKTHLLKLGYGILRSVDEAKEKPNEPILFYRDFTERLCRLFRISPECALINTINNNNKLSISASFCDKGKMTTSFACFDNPDNSKHIDTDNQYFTYDEVKSFPLFFPAKEILSVYDGFRSSLRKRELGFDETYLDFAEALDAAPLRDIDEDLLQGVHISEEIIGNYTVIYDSKTFSFQNKDSPQNSKLTPATLFAEGHNKIGALSHLIRNGSIEEGTSLFWDEPDSNMNPKLIKALAEILAKLSNIMQITIATHSLFLLRELEILQEKKELKNVRYFGLHLSEEYTGVTVMQGDSSDDIGDIIALDESLSQSQRHRDAIFGEEESGK